MPGEYGAGISSAVLNCLNEKYKVINTIDNIFERVKNFKRMQ